MAVLGGGFILSKNRILIRSQTELIPRKSPPPIFISTDRTHVNPHRLRELYSLCNHSCYRFPAVDPGGRVEPVDVDKLRVALTHSSVVVSVFSKPENESGSNARGIGGDWLRWVTPANGELVGFGRAVSDNALTASIHDVMVMPSLQRRGIGRMIVQKILRMLTNREVYDISALCSDEEKPFFKACGFGDDMLESTTMMYTKTIVGFSDGKNIVDSTTR